jgi:cell division protein FtsB
MRVKVLRWIFRILLAACLALALGYLPYRAYGPQGVSKVVRLEQELSRLKSKNQGLRRMNHELRLQIESLKDDTAAIERVARDELGLVRPADVVFQFE